MAKLLTKGQIVSKLSSLDVDWELSKTGTSISRTYKFRNYISGFMFVTKVSVQAEVAGHHPAVLLTYTSVKISITTGDVKALTEADFALARVIDTLYDLSTKKITGPHNHY